MSTEKVITEFILGIPNKAPAGRRRLRGARYIELFSNMQDAAAATAHAVGIYAEDLDAAREKFKALYRRNFQPLRK